MSHRFSLGLAWLPLVQLALAAEPRLNQLQVIGTHNSYHIAPTDELQKLIQLAGKQNAATFVYTHRPLAEQFEELGIRQIELDVFADPEGGMYAKPALREMLKIQRKEPGPDPNASGALARPGFKVLHVQDLDYLSTVPTFVAALEEVRAWSQAHRGHVPIIVLVEAKDEPHAMLKRPVPIGVRLLKELEREILSVFRREELFTPDDLRGDYDSLPQAIQERGWPELSSVRGKVLFALDNEGRIRDRYLQDHPALRGRLMFATVEETDPAAAWFKINDPVAEFERIERLVRAGFLVRTRADADTHEARANQTERRDRALASGAHFVSTDFPEPNPAFSDYHVMLPGRVPARLNPVSADELNGEEPTEEKSQ